MKQLYFLIALCLSQWSAAQISIQHSHLPNDGDTLISRNATLTEGYDLEDTGPNHIWNFNTEVLQPLDLNPPTPCFTLSDLSFIDQAIFNNPFYPEYNSDFGLGFEQADLGFVTFENSYQVYKNSDDVYAVTGVLTSINSIPLIAQMNDRDIIYDIPLTFGTSGSSDSELQFEVPTLGFYGLDQTRNYICDGWGTINIWDQSFEVLRVRSVVNATDSVYAEFIGGGISFDRPESIIYEWISTEFIVPILRITTNGSLVTTIQTADIIDETRVIGQSEQPNFEVFPNPTTDKAQIVSACSGIQSYSLFATSGKLIETGQFMGSVTIDMTDVAPGQYLLRVDCGQKRDHVRLIKQ
jgi:hypothetical protein